MVREPSVDSLRRAKTGRRSQMLERLSELGIGTTNVVNERPSIVAIVRVDLLDESQGHKSRDK